jgi:AcrR family transcriptional regulator
MTTPDTPRTHREVNVADGRTLREQCVDQALAIIAERGVEGLSMRDVARRLHVSHQAPYKHFPSRDHIVAEIVATAFAQFAAHLDGRPRSPDPHQDLGSMGQAYFEFAEQQPLKYRLMFGTPLPDPDQHPEMIRRGRHAFALLEEAVAAVHRSQGRPASPEEIELDAMFVWSTVHGMATIRQTAAQKNLHLEAGTNAAMANHALALIGRALAR